MKQRRGTERAAEKNEDKKDSYTDRQMDVT